jgi:hypothetical protein
MLMKKLLLYSLLVFTTLTGCERDPVLQQPVSQTSSQAQMELVVLGKQGNADFFLNTPVLMPDSSRMRFDELKVYLSDIELQNTSGTWVPVKEYWLADFRRGHSTGKTQHGKGERITITLPEGNYHTVRYCVGLPYRINRTDPTPLAPNHPLSIYQGMYWDWNSGYRFFLMEGMMDTTRTGAGIPDHYFAYHLGLDTLYFCNTAEFPAIQVKSPSRAGELAIPALDIELDVIKVFYGNSDTIRTQLEPITHTSGTFPLALRMNENLKKAWRVIPE